MLPLFAMTVIGYVPAAVLVPAVTVRTEVPEDLIEVTLRVAERPFTSVTPSIVSFTVPLKFSGVIVKVYVAEPPGLTVNTGLSSVNQKSVPTGVRLHAAPGLPEGTLKLELESFNVALCHPEKSSFEFFFGVGNMNGDVEL